eukprot:5312498-Pyramimonas_sp.AAC.1
MSVARSMPSIDPMAPVAEKGDRERRQEPRQQRHPEHEVGDQGLPPGDFKVKLLLSTYQCVERMVNNSAPFFKGTPVPVTCEGAHNTPPNE